MDLFQSVNSQIQGLISDCAAENMALRLFCYNYFKKRHLHMICSILTTFKSSIINPTCLLLHSQSHIWALLSPQDAFTIISCGLMLHTQWSPVSHHSPTHFLLVTIQHWWAATVTHPSHVLQGAAKALPSSRCWSISSSNLLPSFKLQCCDFIYAFAVSGSELELQCLCTHKGCHYRQGGDTHPWDGRANFGKQL